MTKGCKIMGESLSLFNSLGECVRILNEKFKGQNLEQSI